MAIDERAIIDAVAGLGIAGNDEGLIPAFGLYLTRHMADYYNRISYAAARRLERESEVADDARALLVEAGHVCAFNTFGGIMKSAEWDAVVRPMLESPEDWIRGMVAVVNAFGWGRWSIAELSPAERLVIRVKDSYEATGYRRDYGVSDRPRCYLATGGVAGLMNLLYIGDITGAPELDEEYYVKLFRGGDHYVAEEVRCLAMGHDRCELIAGRAGRR
jgi:predicted hydrocarbon binding protein